MSTSALIANSNTSSHPNPTEALITQLSVGPDLRDVAAVLLRQRLRELYPSIDIDPSIAMVGTPSWVIIDDQLVSGTPSYKALTEVLADQVVNRVPALYIEGEHFLTQQPISDPPLHLPIRIDEIAKLINLLAPVMLTAFQEQQLAFWNANEVGSTPRWHELSSTLRKLWNVDRIQGWTVDDCNMARALFRAPALADRTLDDPYQSHAYLIAVDLINGQGVKHLNEVSIVVLIGTQQGRSVILAHSILKGYQKFDSLEQLGATLTEHVSAGESFQQLQWRLLEPVASIFDYQACALISIQIDVIGSLDFSPSGKAPPNRPPSSPIPEVDESVKKPGPGLKWFQDALPEWLGTASLPDLNNYSRHLKDLAALHSQNTGKTYLDGILPIRQYTLSKLNALHAEKIREQRPSPEFETALDSIRLRIKSPVVWGTFVVPGKLDIVDFDIVDLALQNLIALPLGDKSLHSTHGKVLPAWLTTQYIEELIKQVDIGKNYPALIKSTLIGDPLEALRRKRLFSQHLRIQLPLLALQCKIREEAGVDALGYRYVVAAMEPEPRKRVVEGQTIVVRPLSFVPLRRASGAQDEVANMFVIGPEDLTAGPCLLYRPMLDQPLSQYPSPSNLLYAIAQSASLRDSVLAWLPDEVRSDYANYVFAGTSPSPWAISEFLVDSQKLTIMTGPMSLGRTIVQGDIFETLFKANSTALVELADRQSVSNAENRWASFKRAGWMLFSAVLPFLGRTVGIAAWIWQIMDQLEELHVAHEQGDKPTQWAAFTDVLLNLGMAITLHIATQGSVGRRLEEKTPVIAPEAPVAPKIAVSQLVKSMPHEVPDLQQTLSISGAVNRTPASLSTVLSRFRINRPTGIGAANTVEGPYRHLYSHNGKWYAPVGPNWFEVRVDENGTVLIIDPNEITRTGPALTHTIRDEWVVDIRLRLRGGGSTSLTRKAESQAQLEATKLRARLTAFESRKAAAQQALQQAREVMGNASSATAQASRDQYLQMLESQRADYATALADLKTLHVFSPTADYQQKSLGYFKAQLELMHAGIREALTLFTPALRTVLDQIEHQMEDRQERHVAQSRQMIELNQDMITRLEQIQTQFIALRKLEQEGLRLIQHTRKTLPAYSIDDLKALQVTLARNVCLAEHSIATGAEAWRTIDQIVDTAELAVQTLRDTLDERTVARLDERIDSLNELIEQFNAIDERLGDLRTTFPDLVQEEPVAQLRRQLDEFNRRAEDNLVVLLEERDILRARPSLPEPVPRPRKKFIKTRYNGVLIGEPRLTAQGLETDLVDIKSPLNDKIIATFHQKTPGIWVERIKTSTTVIATPNLEMSLNQGQDLLDSLPAFNSRMADHIRQPGRSPNGIEYLFHQHARQLEQVNDAIEQALTDSNSTETKTRSAAIIKKALSDAVDSLNLQATNTMHMMIRQQPPTPSSIDWLNDHQAIRVAKTISRQRIKGTKAFYLDEYCIIDRNSRQALWYAHFLYSTTWVPAKSFVFARLKTPQERELGLSADSPRGLNGTQRLAYYRSMIGLEQAARLFFNAG